MLQALATVVFIPGGIATRIQALYRRGSYSYERNVLYIQRSAPASLNYIGDVHKTEFWELSKSRKFLVARCIATSYAVVRMSFMTRQGARNCR